MYIISRLAKRILNLTKSLRTEFLKAVIPKQILSENNTTQSGINLPMNRKTKTPNDVIRNTRRHASN